MNYNNAHTWCRYDCRKPHYNLQAPLLQKHLITECGASAEIKCGSCKWVVNASPTLSGRIFDIDLVPCSRILLSQTVKVATCRSDKSMAINKPK
ncbi:hypothetical protein QTP88_022091 [Uroleucon formosanum]